MDIYKPDNPVTLPAATQAEPAGFWIRLSAFIIDFICVWFPSFLLSIELGYESSSVFLVVCIPFFYHALAIGTWGQTLGKFLAGILVVTENGEKPGYLKSFGRTLLWYLTLLLILFGSTFNMPSCGAPYPEILIPVFACILLGTFLQRKIFFYDYICGTTVVYKKPIGRLRKTAAILPGIAVIILISYLFITPPRGIPEKARGAEAMSVISNIKSAEERFLSRSGSYTRNLTDLDISYAGMTADALPTKFYTVSISTSGCGEQPCYIVTATRHSKNATIAARYGLYSINAIIPGHPLPQIASCPGGGTNCAEILN